MPQWTAAKMPPQNGRIAVITGANSGLGFENALALARGGALVIMACRSMTKGEAALQSLRTAVPDARVVLRQLDLADLAQIREFAARLRADFDHLDILINNAGIMAVPRTETADGFELQFGVNHLGHFALTGRLLPLLAAAPGSRVVTVSSMVAWAGTIKFDDLQRERGYTRYGAYSQSKLANIHFALELDRRLRGAALPVLSLPAHPGYAATNLQETSASSSEKGLEGRLYRLLNRAVAQSAAMGALPQLYAATAPGVRSGVFYGPDKFARGWPVEITPPRAARSTADAARLWAASEALTGVAYEWGAGESAA